jgi:dihydrofolate reductase
MATSTIWRLGRQTPRSFEHVRGLAGLVYGRGMYEVMRYWDDDLPDWNAEERDFAAVWRPQPKWVVSRTLKSVGPNASLVEGDLDAAIRELKARLDGEIAVGGPDLVRSLRVRDSKSPTQKGVDAAWKSAIIPIEPV